jgi:polyhydroxyalkanoate synthesis regulator phasin
MSLDRLEINSENLRALLQQRKLKREQAERLVNELLRELAKVSSALEASLASSARSIAEIQSLTESLARSEKTSASLEESFDEYVKSSEAAIRSARLQGVAIGAGIIGALWILAKLFGG